MRKMNLGKNFGVFVLFFGLALIEAIQTQNWPKAVVFILLGGIFLWADFPKSNDRSG